MIASWALQPAWRLSSPGVAELYFIPLMLTVTRIDSGYRRRQRGRALARCAVLEALQAQQLLPHLRG